MRTRVVAAAVLLAAALLLARYATSWVQVTPVQEGGTDFSTSYVAALLLRDGHGRQLYDQALEAQRHLALLPAGTRITLPFITPPTTALLALPFTLLDLGTASRVFSVFDLLCLLAALLIAARAAPWPRPTPRIACAAVAAAALAGVATFVLVLLGQLDGLCALGVAAAYWAWRRDRSTLAGFVLGLAFLTLKPHLAVGLAVFLAARRDWRALRGGAGAAALVAGVSLGITGFGGIGSFLATLGESLATTPPASTVGLPGLVASWLGVGAVATVLTLALIVAALAGCVLIGARSRCRRTGLELGLLGATALSLALSPHLLPYDLVVLAPLWVAAMAGAATADGTSPWPGPASAWGLAAWLTANLVTNLDVGTAAPAPPGRLTPLALVAAAVFAWRSFRPSTTKTEETVTARARRARPLQLGSGSGVGGSVE